MLVLFEASDGIDHCTPGLTKVVHILSSIVLLLLREPASAFMVANAMAVCHFGKASAKDYIVQGWTEDELDVGTHLVEIGFTHFSSEDRGQILNFLAHGIS